MNNYMNKYEKAAEYLNSMGFEALNMKNGVSVLMLNEDLTKRHWVDITSENIDYYANAYDATYGGYATLKDMWLGQTSNERLISLTCRLRNLLQSTT